MAWSASAILRSFLVDTLAGTAVFDLDAPADTYMVALFNNSAVPDKDATSANSKYDGGGFVASGNEVIDASNWPTKGRALGSATLTGPVSGIIMFDAADTASSGSTMTASNIYGCLIYNDTKAAPVIDQSVCFVYVGGPQSVTNGTFTIQWSTNGIWRISV
jgi:hypothetical protein